MRKANLFLTDQLQVIQSRIRWLRSFQFIFLVSGLLLIWIAERSAGHQSRPFSSWYFAFVAYISYGFLSVAYVRRRATRGFSRSKLPTKILVQRWLTAESLTLCIAYSPILCFSIERMLLKMPIVFSLPWYALGFILLILWRPSVPEALRNRVSQ
jgi:hypothetical protein